MLLTARWRGARRGGAGAWGRPLGESRREDAGQQGQERQGPHFKTRLEAAGAAPEAGRVEEGCERALKNRKPENRSHCRRSDAPMSGDDGKLPAVAMASAHLSSRRRPRPETASLAQA